MVYPGPARVLIVVVVVAGGATVVVMTEKNALVHGQIPSNPRAGVADADAFRAVTGQLLHTQEQQDINIHMYGARRKHTSTTVCFSELYFEGWDWI